MCHLKIGQALVGRKGNRRIQGGPTALLPPKRLPKCPLRSAARLPLFEIAFVLVRFDHVASFIVNANDGIM